MLESITSAHNDFNQSIQVPPSPFLTFTRRRRPPSSSRAGIKDALGLRRMEGGDAGAFSGSSAVITPRPQRVHPQWQTGLVNRETWIQDSAAKGGEKEPHDPHLPNILFLSSSCPGLPPSLSVSVFPSHQHHHHHGLTGSPTSSTFHRDKTVQQDRHRQACFAFLCGCYPVSVSHTQTHRIQTCVYFRDREREGLMGNQ